MRLLSETTVRARMVLSFGLLIAVILAVGLVALDRVTAIDRVLQSVSERRLPKVELARKALRYSNRNSRITMEIFLLDDPEVVKARLAERAANTATITELHAELARLLDSVEERRLFLAVRSSREPYVESYLRAIRLLLETKDPASARHVMSEETLPLIFKYHAAVEAFVEFEAAQMSRESSLASGQALSARSTLFILLWTAVLAASAIGAMTAIEILDEMRRRRHAEAQLRSSNDSLERQVAERTTELATTNRKLEGEIRERRRAVEAMLQRETDLNEAQRVAHVGSWDWIIASDEVHWSDELYRIAGRDRTSNPPGFAGQWQLYTPESWAKLREAVERTAETGEPYEIEIQFVRPDGLNPWIVATGEARRDAAGRIVGVRGTAQDVTERRRLEEQLRQAQKMEAIGQLAGGVAHDFNNLLTVISGNADMLLANPRADVAERGPLSDIHAAAERAASLTRQLLAFSRKQILESKLVDLHEIINGIEKMLRRLIGEDVELSTDLAADPSWVKVDSGQLEQVIMNLAVNARDAMPRGGRLTIRTRTLDPNEPAGFEETAERRQRRKVAMSISDTGHGISADAKIHLFEPFFTTKGVGRGTGLGLATVYGIVKQSDGDILVESEPGHGATFTIVLPLHSAPRHARDASASRRALPHGTETVLVVEDEDAVRRVVTSALESTGYRVIEARSGSEALELARTRTGGIHLVVTDVVMPEMSGRELVERLRLEHRGLRILYMSGYTDDAVVRHGVVESGVAFLQKPFSLLTLARKVREVLDGTLSEPPQGSA